jgi:ribosomal protein S18 acetylase RimI-like enzyme
VSRLHCASLTGLLSSLGFRATRAFYAGALKTPLAIGFVCTEGGTLLGHVFGSVRPDRLRAEALRANRFQVLAGLCLGVARRPSALRLLLRSGQGPDEGTYDPRQPELTYLAVAPESRGAGIGRQLVAVFSEAMRQAGAQAYELSVDDENHPAIVFYERRGFRLVGRYREFGIVHRRYRFELGRG